jgi:hypothetical protein
VSAPIVARSEASFPVPVAIPSRSAILDFAQTLPERLTQAGVGAPQEPWPRFDPDGSSRVVGSITGTRNAQRPTEDPTPSGGATVARHVDPSPHRGTTSGPLDREARIVVRSTPRFATLIAPTDAEVGAGRVLRDRDENPGRTVPRSFVPTVADAVAAVALAQAESGNDAWPAREQPVPTLTRGLEGTCRLRGEAGWRETRVGTMGFSDPAGERPHPISRAATPESGPATVVDRRDRAIERVKALSPQARSVGSADGARGIWDVVAPRTGTPIVGCSPAAASLAAAADVRVAGTPQEQERWWEDRGHRVKHESGAAGAIRKEWQHRSPVSRTAQGHVDGEDALTAFSNPNPTGRRDDAAWVEEAVPIGSGVTDAACPVSVTQRRWGSGMRGKEAGAAAVWSVRCRTSTRERWSQFWDKIDRYGFPVAA